MDNWYNYVDCGAKLCQIMFRNSMLLSGNSFARKMYNNAICWIRKSVFYIDLKRELLCMII